MSETAATVVVDFPATPRRVFQNATALLVARSLDEVTAVIDAAERAAKAGKYVAGFVCYEAAPAFDAALRVRNGAEMPLAWFAVFDDFTSATPFVRANAEQTDWRLATTALAFDIKVERIREEIAAGRTYQVNLTERLIADFGSDPFGFYEKLRRAQGAGYHAYIDTSDFVILSASPELFFEIRGRHIRTKPMKGTRARGRFNEEDELVERELAGSEKDRAENLMIVDLLRNDLGRVAKTGSVAVTSLFAIERYRTVHQMVSVIEAELPDSVSLLDVFGALFPCGSVTGAPKISTMRLITELEDMPREVYCGAIGMLEPQGVATFSVPIRTVSVDRVMKRAVYGTGAGITFDSDAAAEYDEIIAKAAVLREDWPDFELLETMRVENGRIARLDRHLKRLLASAEYFGISVRSETISTVLKEIGEANGRLRLLVDQSGRARVEVRPLEPAVDARVALAGSPVLSHDRFLFHKTTQRRVYEQHQLEGYWDVLLWNEHEEVTEFTRGNVVIDIGGRMLTPPRACGLLAGTFRAELLESGVIAEEIVTLDALARATRVWFVNSLREWVPTRVQFTVYERP